jgi:selenocysteine lyase/cysteine desulfurase
MSERLASEWTPPLRGYSNLAPSRNPQYGHANYPGIYALNASLQYFESIGWDAIHRRVSCLSARLHNSLSSRGFEILTPADARAGIVSVRRENAQALVRALAAEAIFVEDRDEIVRASPHFYNTDDDIDRFVSSLAQHA